MSFKDIKVIVARDQNYLIGLGLKMPQGHLTDDLKLLVWKTMGGLVPVIGNPVIIGHRTAQSLVSMVGGPYKNRTTIVITSNGDDELERLGFIVFKGKYAFEDAMNYAEHDCPGTEIWIAGGGSIYEQAFKLHKVYEVHETIIHERFEVPEGVLPVYFNGFYENLYRVLLEESYKKRDPGTNSPKDRGNKHDFTVKVHRINF